MSLLEATVIDYKLRPFLKKINQSPSPDGWNFNPVSLIRAVNALHSLGFEHVQTILKAYANIAEANPRQAEIEGLDTTRVLLIIRLLFVPRDPLTTLPPLILGRSDVNLPQEDPVWTQLPLVLSLDLPFLPVGGYFVGGAMRSVLHYLDEYISLGQLRDKPISPKGSPIEAVEFLVKSENWRLLIPPEQEPWVRFMVFGQALRAMEPVYVVDKTIYQAPVGFTPDELSALWQRHAKAVQSLKLRWDPTTQSFIPTHKKEIES